MQVRFLLIFLLGSVGLTAQLDLNPQDPDSVHVVQLNGTVSLTGFYPGQTVRRDIQMDSAIYSKMLISLYRMGGDIGGVNVRGVNAESADYLRIWRNRERRKQVMSTNDLQLLWTIHTGLDWSWAMSDFDSLYVGRWELLEGRKVTDTLTVIHRPNHMRVTSTSHGSGVLEVFGSARIRLRGLKGLPRVTLIRRKPDLLSDLDNWFKLRSIER